MCTDAAKDRMGPAARGARVATNCVTLVSFKMKTKALHWIRSSDSDADAPAAKAVAPMAVDGAQGMGAAAAAVAAAAQEEEYFSDE